MADPYFHGLSQPSREPSAQPVSKLAFEFERRKLNVDEVRDLIYRETLEYHPQMLADYMAGGRRQPNFVYPSAGQYVLRADCPGFICNVMMWGCILNMHCRAPPPPRVCMNLHR